MSAVDLGAEFLASWASRPPGATISIEVSRPDGTPGTATVDDAAGTARIVADMAGRWFIRWVATDSAAVFTDVFDVWPEDPRFLISLDDAAEGLNATRANPQYLADLRLYIAAATPVIEDIVGPVLSTGYTWQTSGGRSAVILPHGAATITVVEANEIPVTGYWTEHGVLYAGSRLAPGTFPAGTLTVAYNVGSTAVKPNIRLAARELVRHWVQIGKQATGGVRNTEFDGDVYTPSGFAVPRRVIELCAPDEQIGGFA
ncbi:hypothetical protein CGQ24_08220 [Arthrobacter sp. 7749]|nr:hypothetical protein CGQ24_08220 [Arthrobacter sp. 7749]